MYKEPGKAEHTYHPFDEEGEKGGREDPCSPLDHLVYSNRGAPGSVRFSVVRSKWRIKEDTVLSWLVNVNLTQARAILEGGTLIEKAPLID